MIGKIIVSARPPTVKPLDESGPYSLVFSGANGEELAQYHVRRLSDGILRTRQLDTPIGAVAERASIYSADGKLFWSRSFGQQQKKVMQVNAQRILLRLIK
jgi:hypothetical protein